MKGVPTCQTGTEVGFIWVRRIDLDAQRLFLETTTCWTRDAKGKELFINNRRTMPPCTPTAANRLHNGPSPPTYPTFHHRTCTQQDNLPILIGKDKRSRHVKFDAIR